MFTIKPYRSLTKAIEAAGYNTPSADQLLSIVPESLTESLTVGTHSDGTFKYSDNNLMHIATKELFCILDRLDSKIGSKWFELICDERDYEFYCFLSGPGSWLLSRLIQFDNFVMCPIFLSKNTDVRDEQLNPESSMLLSSGQFLKWVKERIELAFASIEDTIILPTLRREAYVISHHEQVSMHVQIDGLFGIDLEALYLQDT